MHHLMSTEWATLEKYPKVKMLFGVNKSSKLKFKKVLYFFKELNILSYSDVTYARR